MSLARTLRLKKLVITESKIRFERFRKDKAAKNRKDCVWVKSSHQLRKYHFFPVQNCEVFVLGNSPILGSDEFRSLMFEKSVPENARVGEAT